MCVSLVIIYLTYIVSYTSYLLRERKKNKTPKLVISKLKRGRLGKHTYTYTRPSPSSTHRHIKTNTATAKVLMKYARGKGYLLDGRLSNLSKRHFAQVYTDTSPTTRPPFVYISPVFDFFVSPVRLSSETH